MKKSVRILLVIVLCLVLIAISLPGGISFNKYHYDDATRYTAGGCEIDRQVKNIDISWVAGKVNVALHEGDEIILSETASRRLKENEELRWLVDGDTLYVKYLRSGVNFSSGLHKEMTLLLPENHQLKNILVSSVSAEIEADLPETDVVDIQSVSGSADVLFRETGEVRVNTVSGSLLLCFAAAPESIDADAISGGITIQLPKDAGFTVNMDSVSGRIGGDLLEGAAEVKNYTRGRGECRISMNSVSGGLRLDAYTR